MQNNTMNIELMCPVRLRVAKGESSIGRSKVALASFHPFNSSRMGFPWCNIRIHENDRDDMPLHVLSVASFALVQLYTTTISNKGPAPGGEEHDNAQNILDKCTIMLQRF
jgi:hypothetical protein